MPKLNRILILQTAFTGDVILSTPLAEAIHASDSNIQIDYLVRKSNEGLFKNHPFIGDILVWDKSKNKYKNLFQILNKIRQNKYDVIVNCQRFAASGFLTVFSSAKIKIGFDKNPFSILFDHKITHEIGNGKHECERNLALLNPLGISGNIRPKLYPPENPIKGKQNYITISPASVWFTKQWAEEKWIDFIRQVPKHLEIYFLGGPSDKDLCDRILQKAQISNGINLCGKISLLESAAVIRDAQMNYVNDSAPMHLASSVNAPTAAIYCSTVPSFGFGPLSDNSITIETEENLSCRPCGLHGKKACPEGHFRCALTIDVQRLLRLLPNAS
jgi:ADP-heptose:LPS heptosyltransferase